MTRANDAESVLSGILDVDWMEQIGVAVSWGAIVYMDFRAVDEVLFVVDLCAGFGVCADDVWVLQAELFFGGQVCQG